MLPRYGTGNIPVDTQPEILQTLREAAERGVIIVTITQCFKGRAEPNYATGKALVDNGVVCGCVSCAWLGWHTCPCFDADPLRGFLSSTSKNLV
jgi:hypothetical protein